MDFDVVLPQQIYSVLHELVIVWLMSRRPFQAFDARLLLKLQPSLSGSKLVGVSMHHPQH